MKCQGIKGSSQVEKETSFLFLTTIMGPKLTPLFNPESDKEANRAIQEAEDMKAELAHPNKGLQEWNQKVEAAKAAKAK